MREWTTCEICHRVIWVEDGPICVDCRVAEQVTEAEEETEEEED